MPPVAYSGALPPKKKSELQEIAAALRLSDQGTKDELQARIKKHLDSNQDALEDDPTFAGLFGRRKRSVQPQPIPQGLRCDTPPLLSPHVNLLTQCLSGRFAPSGSDAQEKPRSSIGRRSTTSLDPIKETTPVKDLRDVSTFLKHPFSPLESTPNQSSRQVDVTTPSSLPPLPPSPAKSIVDNLPKAADVKAAVQQFRQQQVLQNGNELLIALRVFLSNSRNIWSLTAVFELLYILTVTIPWQFLEVPVTPRGAAGATISVAYPPWTTFQTSTFWQVILQWAIPTLILPTQSPGFPAAPVAPLDPLTASIIRLAAQTAYPYPAIGKYVDVVNLDVLGSNWRILSASVGLAFAFAEAIAGAPQIITKTLVREQRKQIQFNLDDYEREATPGRRALMAQEEHHDAEVD
ncbi:hypothetical protein BDZ97DRAFT_1806136 [Flammula alnicola]|nr:hypothetical protein BDZ97DRAFT_1806136 [Flammula alnicola]